MVSYLILKHILAILRYLPLFIDNLVMISVHSNAPESPFFAQVRPGQQYGPDDLSHDSPCFAHPTLHFLELGSHTKPEQHVSFLLPIVKNWQWSPDWSHPVIKTI